MEVGFSQSSHKLTTTEFRILYSSMEQKLAAVTWCACLVRVRWPYRRNESAMPCVLDCPATKAHLLTKHFEGCDFNMKSTKHEDILIFIIHFIPCPLNLFIQAQQWLVYSNYWNLGGVDVLDSRLDWRFSWNELSQPTNKHYQNISAGVNWLEAHRTW